MASILTLGISYSTLYYKNINKKNEIAVVSELDTKEEAIIEEIPERIEVYDGLTYEELVDKLNRSLSSDLTGKGSVYADYALEFGVDPYLAVAISLHETGCTWDCSYLAKVCHNIGGQKGSGCGEYAAFDSLDSGIYAFISNIKRNYVDYGLMTAEEMGPKYAGDPEWASKVNRYVEKIRNN